LLVRNTGGLGTSFFSGRNRLGHQRALARCVLATAGRELQLPPVRIPCADSGARSFGGGKMSKTIPDLKALRAELVNRRRQEAYWIRGPQHDERLQKIAHVHLAIAALDAVMAEGKDQTEVKVPGFERPLGSEGSIATQLGLSASPVGSWERPKPPSSWRGVLRRKPGWAPTPIAVSAPSTGFSIRLKGNADGACRPDDAQAGGLSRHARTRPSSGAHATQRGLYDEAGPGSVSQFRRQYQGRPRQPEARFRPTLYRSTPGARPSSRERTSQPTRLISSSLSLAT